MAAGRHTPGFLKLLSLHVSMCACLYVSVSAPRALISSGVIHIALMLPSQYGTEGNIRYVTLWIPLIFGLKVLHGVIYSVCV